MYRRADPDRLRRRPVQKKTTLNRDLKFTKTALQLHSRIPDSFQKLVNDMTRHASYGKTNKGGKKRNVLKRFERVDMLRKLGKWVDGTNTKVTGLPKTPTV